MNFSAQDRCIYYIVHGSQAYGMATPESDFDYKGVTIPPLAYHFGFLHHFEQEEHMASKHGGDDSVIYSLKKFVQLACDCNPNIIEILWVDDSNIKKIDKYGEELRANRELFLSKNARHRFAGYAYAQVKRIKTHREWLLNPPSHKPTRGEYGLTETTKVSKSVLGAFDAVVEHGVEVEIPKDIMLLYTLEKRYQQAMNYYEQYEHWKKTRNPKRAVLEEKFGFDVKHAAHAVRLSRMCVEILECKGVLVKRPDADDLLAIRRGEWEYERVLEEVRVLDERANELYTTSSLRHQPDRKKLDELVVSMTERYIHEHG